MTGDIRQDVTDVLVRYATGIDRRDWVLFRTCFTKDCDADYGDVGHWHSADEITGFMTEVHEPCGPTLHRITNVAVDVRPGYDRATAHSYVDAIVMGADGRSGVQAIGRYDDELVRTSDGWRIARRVCTLVLVQPIGETDSAGAGAGAAAPP
jgi:3-phenylpropionate/cinnamic acid dioxygenase small subunit